MIRRDVVVWEFNRNGDCEPVGAPDTEVWEDMDGAPRFIVHGNYQKVGTLGGGNTMLALDLYESMSESPYYPYAVIANTVTGGPAQGFLCAGPLELAALVKELSPLWMQAFTAKASASAPEEPSPSGGHHGASPMEQPPIPANLMGTKELLQRYQKSVEDEWRCRPPRPEDK